MKIDEFTSTAFATKPSAERSTPHREEFLRLLVAQLEQQNPLEPQSGHEFVAQLAQFASVEQSAETNRLLEEVRAEQAAASHLALAGFLGKSARFVASAFQLTGEGGNVPEMIVKLEEPASAVTADLVDGAGHVVRTIDLGPRLQGEFPVTWDSTDANGAPLKEGVYAVRIRALKQDGSEVGSRVLLGGVIDSVVFENGFPRLRVGSVAVAPGNVISIQ